MTTKTKPSSDEFDITNLVYADVIQGGCFLPSNVPCLRSDDAVGLEFLDGSL